MQSEHSWENTITINREFMQSKIARDDLEGRVFTKQKWISIAPIMNAEWALVG